MAADNQTMSSLSLMTFNMHGFNQGETFLSDACSSNKYDVICLQEHWLSSDGMTKLVNFNNDYTVFGESAMTQSTTTGVLYGRPYGGVASLVRRSLINEARCLLLGERVVIIKVCNSIFINAYFPCDDGSLASYDLLIDMLSQMTNVLNDAKFDYVFLSGDFNVNLDLQRRNAVLIKSFLCDNNMSFKLPMDTNRSTLPTFNNNNSGSSTIDFICLPVGLHLYVKEYDVVDSYCNFSDHSPVYLLLSIPSDNVLGHNMLACRSGVSAVKCDQQQSGSQTNKIVIDAIHEQPRFDHACLPAYYECTRLLLQPIADELLVATDDNVNTGHVGGAEMLLEIWYTRIVSALKTAETKFIPRMKVNALKFWWNAELNELKQKAIRSHNLWVKCDKPRNGIVFNMRNSDKRAYRAVIAQHKTNEKLAVSNDLHDSLLAKRPNEFWRVWKTKVCDSKTDLPCVDGCFDDHAVSQKFMDHFKETCTVNSTGIDLHFRKLYMEKVNLYLSQENGAKKSIAFLLILN